VTDPLPLSAVSAAHETTERIALQESEIDGLGHLNQARYHYLLGRARSRVLREHLPVRDGGERPRFVLARTELDYHREIRLADVYVEARAQVVRVGNKSVQITNELIRPDGSVAASGTATMVAWDPEGRHSRALSDAERSALGRVIAAAQHG
jgi:acyl-CoA thioester hydrolase